MKLPYAVYIWQISQRQDPDPRILFFRCVGHMNMKVIFNDTDSATYAGFHFHSDQTLSVGRQKFSVNVILVTTQIVEICCECLLVSEIYQKLKTNNS